MKKFYGLLIVGLILSFVVGLNLVHAATLFSDNFDDGNSSGWTTQNGAWSVVQDSGSYVFYQSSTGEGRAWTGSSSWTNYAVEAKVKVDNFNGSNRAYVCARMKDGNNYYAASLVGGGKLEIRKKVSGSTSTLVSKNYSLSTGTWYKVKLEVNGTSLKMYVNDALQLSATDSSISAGGVGVIGYKAVCKFDDVVVSDGGTSTTSQPPTSTATTSTQPTSTATATATATATTSIAPSPTATLSSGDLFVGPNGSASNPGTQSSPLTLDAA
ncbi:MAG TPA: LamG-like jellyroll fold domain-containing protein, partial [Bacillota bacterium]|nr:LamG-like jellyroll fold domain-containing protein [Bacillota bacterium]